MTAEQAMTVLMAYKFSKTKIAAEKEEVKSAEKPTRSKLEEMIEQEIEQYYKKHPSTSSAIKKLRAELGPFKYPPAPFQAHDLALRRIAYVSGNIYVGEVKADTDIKHGRGVEIKVSLTPQLIKESWFENNKACSSGRIIWSSGSIY